MRLRRCSSVSPVMEDGELLLLLSLEARSGGVDLRILLRSKMRRRDLSARMEEEGCSWGGWGKWGPPVVVWELGGVMREEEEEEEG